MRRISYELNTKQKKEKKMLKTGKDPKANMRR